MSSHELNVRKAITWSYPDYIPGSIGVRGDGWHKYGIQLNDLFQRHLGIRPYPDSEIPGPLPGNMTEHGYYHKWTDGWGCVIEEVVFGIHGMITGHPVDDWGKLEDLKIPEGPSPDMRLFERMQWIRGYANLMIDFAMGEWAKLDKLASMIMEHNLRTVQEAIRTGKEMVYFQDDWGTQTSLMISPTMWRSFFKPKYAEMFRPAKEAGLLVHFHSDGYIIDILPDLQEIGVDVINLQTNCHDVVRLGDLCRDLELCISADMDRQGTLSFGLPADVRAYFDKIANAIGDRRGGLLFSVECGADTPLANIEAAMKALVDYRHRGL